MFHARVKDYLSYSKKHSDWLKDPAKVKDIAFLNLLNQLQTLDDNFHMLIESYLPLFQFSIYLKSFN